VAIFHPKNVVLCADNAAKDRSTQLKSREIIPRQVVGEVAAEVNCKRSRATSTRVTVVHNVKDKVTLAFTKGLRESDRDGLLAAIE
jgi:hypothetical protein